MAAFSLEQYQQSLADIDVEIRKYGESRKALALSTEALVQLNKTNAEIGLQQQELSERLQENTIKLEAVIESSNSSVVRTRIALEEIETNLERLRMQSNELGATLDDLVQNRVDFETFNAHSSQSMNDASEVKRQLAVMVVMQNQIRAVEYTILVVALCAFVLLVIMVF